MRDFLRENWLWIAAPVVIFAIALVVVLWLTRDGASPHVYTFW
jgi:hypothetical protein